MFGNAMQRSATSPDILQYWVCANVCRRAATSQLTVGNCISFGDSNCCRDAYSQQHLLPPQNFQNSKGCSTRVREN